MKPLLPPPGAQPMLANNAKASELLARLLDALLVLDVEGSCSIGDLAQRVGVKAERLRELLSSFMVAGPEAVGPGTPFSIVFGNASGPYDADDLFDAEQSGDYVYLESTMRKEQVSLIDDLGRAPVTVDQVAAAVLAGRALLESGFVEERYREPVESLIARLADAMNMRLNEALDPDAQLLRSAADLRQRVSFRHRDLVTGADMPVTVEPYDVRRRRDSLVLDAGPDPSGWRSYEISSLSDVSRVGEPGAFKPPTLPSRDRRERSVDVVLRVPRHSPQWDRLRDGWNGVVIASTATAVDVKVEVDEPAESKVAVLLLQLGPECALVSPASVQDAVRAIARRLVDAHQGTG